MKKYFSKNNLLIIVILVIVVLIIFKITIQQKDVKLNQQYNNNIELQEKCAIQSEKVLNNFKEKTKSINFFGFKQKNHYNKNLNKCFVLISYIYSTDITHASDLSSHKVLFDAYENKELASYKCLSNFDDPCTKPTFCYINNNENKITSCEEYINFVNQRME